MSGMNWLRTLLVDSTILLAICGDTRTEYLGLYNQGPFIQQREIEGIKQHMVQYIINDKFNLLEK